MLVTLDHASRAVPRKTAPSLNAGRMLSTCALWLWAALLSVPPLAAEEESPQDKKMFNVPVKTLGGKQLWTDHHHFRDWRIQQNALTGHFRLLDPGNTRRAWGEYDQCVQTLERVKVDQELAPVTGQVVVLLHGLMRSRDSMRGMARFLGEQSEFPILNVGYASTRSPLSGHVAALAHIVKQLDQVEEVHFVAHSLGNLIVRHYLADRYRQPEAAAGLPRIGRIVMLGAPNQGAELAQKLKDVQLFRAITGHSGNQLGAAWEDLQRHLATPRGPFGIIAGKGPLPNPLLSGEGDMVVSIRETRLVGATDFCVVPASHTFLMDDQAVQQMTLRFLEYGYFLQPDRRHPIRQLEMTPEECQEFGLNGKE